MEIGFVFPGQGSQSVGMGKELYESLPAARRILDEASKELPVDLKSLMFEGPADILTDTRYAQAAIYTCSAMYLEKAKDMGLSCSCVLGHSLGEYSALYAAGVFSFSDGLHLVWKRGEAMAAENGKGGMAAVLGLTEEELAPICRECGGVVPANLNTRTQIVVSGSLEGLDRLEERLRERDPADETPVLVKRLAVSAAFHSPSMRDAAEAMRGELDRAALHEPSCFVIPNVTGIPTKDPETIRDCLLRQITSQVRWYDSVLAAKELGIEKLYEIGHGNVLRKMQRGLSQLKCVGL